MNLINLSNPTKGKNGVSLKPTFGSGRSFRIVKVSISGRETTVGYIYKYGAIEVKEAQLEVVEKNLSKINSLISSESYIDKVTGKKADFERRLNERKIFGI